MCAQISDGAAALLIVNERGVKKLGGVRPRARIVAMALSGTDPVISTLFLLFDVCSLLFIALRCFSVLEGPIPATRAVLRRAGLTIDQIDLYEVNEAFAPVPVAWCKALNADVNKLNVNGGAMALGHPLGATGAKLMATLLCELERRKKRYGLLAICEGGGTANATIIERLPGPEEPAVRSKL